jgi:hypothetical protein
LQVSPPTEEADKMILSLEEQNQLLKIQDERQRAVTKARLEAQQDCMMRQAALSTFLP